MGTYRKEVFRKSLHLLGIAGVTAWFYSLQDWKQSVIVTLAALVVIFPVLFILSKVPGLTGFFNARKPGEYAMSCAALMITYAIVASVCWGYFGHRILGVACFLAWGPGDAAAALVGKKYGRHKAGKNKVKSLEGSGAMLICSFISVLLVLYFSKLYSIPLTILISFLTALATTIAELLDYKGDDTAFCPLTAMVVLSLFQLIL